MLSHKIKEEMEETEEEGMEVEKSEDEKQMEAMQKMAGIRNEYGMEHDPNQIGDLNKDGKIDMDDANLKEDDEEEYSDESEDEMDMDMDSEEEYSDEDEMDVDMGSEDEMDMDMDMGSEESEEVSDEELEEILRELDAEGEESEETESVYENKSRRKKGSKKTSKLMEGMIDFCGDQSNKGDAGWEMCESAQFQEGMIDFCGDASNKGSDAYQYCEGMSNSDDEEIDLAEIVAALREEDDAPEGEAPEASEELEEAYGVIKYLRTKINEVNLLNAKLLYVNKLFRKGELTETQKVKIIETFDRAKNVREAKLIYATLAESVSNKKRKTTVAPKRKMNEGFASAPSKKTQIISESNGVYNRFKTLVEYNNKK